MTPEGPLLSVVVPFYNVQDYIGECLESLRTQTLTDLEVILVDDGSPDDSLAVAQAYVDRDPRFRLVRQANQGLGPARNTGLGHATGRYLAFVDSDDVLAPRAYSMLVGSLERTGSDIAGGNAYRFNDTDGVYQSWTHREPFEQTRPGTTIDAFPDLMRDRMVWNKVYRRSFWDEHGFRFPAIRYEDYPVTLPAYLVARRVDVLADHVYFWRDRASGDSITQQSARLDNVRDRVSSALLVLDGLDASGGRHAEVRRRVHAYFVDIDLVTVAEALVRALGDDQPELERLAYALADRLEPRSSLRATRLARLLHRTLRRRDVELARALVRWRAGGGTPALVAEVRALPQGLRHLPAVLDAVTPRKPPQNPLRPRRLRSELVEACWEGDELHLVLDSRLRGSLAGRATGRARLGRRVPLTATTTRTAEGVRWEVVIGPDALTRLEPGRLGLVGLSLRVGVLRWSGSAMAVPPMLPGAHRLADGTAHQLRAEEEEPELLVEALTDPVLATVAVAAEGFVVGLDVEPAAGDAVLLQRPAPTPELVLEHSGATVRFPAATVMADDPIDDPVSGVDERPLLLRRADGSQVPLHLAGPGVGVELPGARVRLDVSWDGALVVRRDVSGTRGA